MKKNMYWIVSFLFVAILWVPLIGTPFRVDKEHEALVEAERRCPQGTLSLKECQGDVELWVKQVRLWYADSFAFRAHLMAVYNMAHYAIRNYPTAYAGKRGYVIKRKWICESLTPIPEVQWEVRSQSLEKIHQLCEQSKTPCLFVVIPSKKTIHPELFPRWIRQRDSNARRERLVCLIREKGLPVVDLTSALRADAERTKRVLFRKYDTHWSVEGSVVGYREMIPAIQQFIPEARLLSDEDYMMVTDEFATRFSKKYYLDAICSEPLTKIEKINLPPVKVVRGTNVRVRTVQDVPRLQTVEVFCEGLGDSTVLFVRDSFLKMPSPLLNHSFAHTVYLNNSGAGKDPKTVLETFKPDLLVIALQQKVMGDYLDRMGE